MTTDREAAMDEALQRLSACATPEALVERLIEEAVALTGSTMGYFATADEAKGELVMLGWSKGAMAACGLRDKPILYPIEATGLWGDCIRERRPIITNDYPGCRRVTKKGTPDGHVPVLRHLNVPVFSGGRIVGILGVGNREAEYGEGDAAGLQAFANAAWPLFAARAGRGTT